MSIKHAWKAISSLTLSSVAFAQTTSGTLTYGPASVTAAPTPVDAVAPAVPVPIPSLLLIPLGVLMAVIGYRALRSPQGRKLLSVMLLGAGLTLSALGSLNIPQALASMLALDNPAGGVINLPVDPVEISNTSGVALKLDAISIESSCISQDPANECLSGQILEDGGTCMIENKCASESQKVVFVTSETYTGDLRETPEGTGLEGADAKCNALAVEANLPGEFKAWLSDSNFDVRDRFIPSSVPYRDVQGSLIADSFFDLAPLEAPINVNEMGDTIVTVPVAWTNSSEDGSAIFPITPINICDDWGTSSYAPPSNNFIGATGNVSDRFEWTAITAQPCSLLARLYCFEQ
ncbi:MAG: midcut-by-XrtH protein [Halieaceae bacterium]|nr:midcut-by-XrtH protein [Halieaceae bacterium]